MAGFEKPQRGLIAAEWAMVAYAVATTLIILFTWSRLTDPTAMLTLRLKIIVITAVAVGLYLLLPCPLTRLVRIIVQLVMLSWWYPDTYELNRILPNLDHHFATADQLMFGCQPALLFAEVVHYAGHIVEAIVSELMCLGYVCYYPLIAIVVLYYFFWHQRDLGRAAFIIIAAFFIYYAVFIVLPVAGPQYYYPAVGMDDIARGLFPAMGNHFATLREALPTPGWDGGFFYGLVADAHNAGERPTAAFPSSHVGITTILMMLVWRAKGRNLFRALMPLYTLLCLSTVYIYAHYVIDVFGGWISAFILYFLLGALYRGK